MACMASDLLSPSEAASRLGIHVSTLKRHTRKGAIPSVKTPGGWHRYRLDELDAWLESHRNGGSAA